MDDFIWRALLGGIGVAIVTGPLGCFVIWRRMAYFGDTLAHSALLGVAIGFWLHIHPTVGIIGICLITALILGILQQQSYLAVDTLLGILSHTALSLGLVAIAFLKGIRIDLYAYLFGDLLAVTTADLYWIYGGGSVLMLILMKLWQPMLSMTVHEELARIEGVAVVPVRLIFMLMMALVIAAAMKIVGILLITSLLIIPAATARRFAQTPEQMAGLAVLIGCLAVGLGLLLSLYGDTPTGPSVVVAASTLFTVTLLWKTG